MEHLFERNYQAVIARGVINDQTTDMDFLRKCEEEFSEIRRELILNQRNATNEEIADFMNTCHSWLRFRGANVIEELTKVAIKNENRSKRHGDYYDQIMKGVSDIFDIVATRKYPALSFQALMNEYMSKVMFMELINETECLNHNYQCLKNSSIRYCTCCAKVVEY